MRFAVRIGSFWPGFPWVWYRGSKVGLFIAIAFGFLLNFVLVSSFIWVELVSEPVRRGACAGALVSSITAGIHFWFRYRGCLSSFLDSWNASNEDLFLAAQLQYLKGDWTSSEKTLLRILQGFPRDAESRLLLATLYRHQGQYESARDQLRVLQRFDSAANWAMEIQYEWNLIDLSENRDGSVAVQSEESDQSDLNDPDQGALRDVA